HGGRFGVPWRSRVESRSYRTQVNHFPAEPEFILRTRQNQEPVLRELRSGMGLDGFAARVELVVGNGDEVVPGVPVSVHHFVWSQAPVGTGGVQVQISPIPVAGRLEPAEIHALQELSPI